MTTHEELGAMIREARLEKGMSLGQLASAIGRSSSSVRRWERGEVTPAVSVIPKLAAILEIDPDEFTVATSSASDSDGRSSTIEQPIVEGHAAPDPELVHSPGQAAESESGLFTDMWRAITSGGRGWMGWIRGLSTAGVLIVMLLVLLWAVGELFGALEAVLDSFDVGTNGTESP